MKTLSHFSLSLAALCGFAAAVSAQNVDYCLPQTSLTVEVEAVSEQFFSGPYADYAEKLLGIKVSREDKQSLQITQVRITPYLEADPAAHYSLPADYAESLLKFSSSGLISVSSEAASEPSVWRFPMSSESNFADKGVTSALTSESSVLYASGAADFSRISVRQDVLVKKTESQRAAEMAKKILEIRDMRYKITIGDTDATYSGEALGAAIEELTRLEKEYMSLFIGYTVTRKQTMSFELTPTRSNENQIYVAFRVSDSEGLLPSDNISGRPVLLEIGNLPEEQAVETGKKKKVDKKAVLLHYRTPAVCTVKLTDGLRLLMQTRIPISQFGEDMAYAVPAKKK